MTAPTVLVAEDDSDVRQMIRLLLETAGYPVIDAKDGLTAWEKTQRHRPGVVVADVQMPGMTGIELCRAIKGEFPSIKVIVFTAGMATPDEADEAGADFYLLKTDSPARLREAVQRLSETNQ